MKKIFIFSLVVLVFATMFLIGCQEEDIVPEVVQIANPASVNCIDNGGELEILDGDNGQYGLCTFDDGSVCEEWAFFREECFKGESLI